MEQKRERIKQESIIDALSDDRVVDEESFQKAVRARERRALEDEEGISGPLKDRDAGTAPLTTTGENGSQRTQQTSLNGNHSSPAPAANGKASSAISPASSSTEDTSSPQLRPSRQQTKQDKEIPKLKRWAQDEYGKEYPISTERAEAIARWIKEAPLSMGGPGMKKKKKRSSATTAARVTASTSGEAEPTNVGGAINGIAGLKVVEEGPD